MSDRLQGYMTETTHARKFGELLVDLEVLSPEQVAESQQIAAQINLPLGRTLILANKLPEDELRVILQLRVLLRDDHIDLPVAKKVFHLVRNEKLSLSQALEKLGVKSKKGEHKPSQSSLAALLIDAGIVTQPQVDEALKVGYETGTPVGHMLVVSSIVNHSVMARALEIQVMLREGKMSHGQALELLKAESLRIVPVEQSAEQRGLSRQDANKKVRLGELLMLSGILTEANMLNVLEVGLTTPKPLGDILIETGLITKELLDTALKMQEMISSGLIDIRAAASVLQEMSVTGKVVDPSECKLSESPELRIGDLLRNAGLVDSDDIQEAIALSSQYPAMIGKMLLAAGSIDEGTLLAALRCQFLLRNKAISDDEAQEALLYAQRHRISLDDALEELGIRNQTI